MMRKTIGATIALWLGLAGTTAHAAEAHKCLSEGEAGSLIVTVLPDLVEGLSAKCASVLPDSATLRAGLPALRDRYRAASDLAWPQAIEALHKLGGKELADTDAALLRPLLSSKIAGGLAADVKPEQCAHFDRLLSAMSPLPAGNIADIFVSILQLSGKRDDRLGICADGISTTATLREARP